jgi:GT2 family glycosyltransferase
MTDQVEISVIIVSYNTRDLIATCLDSIVHVNEGRKEIFVVDNASTDGSVELIRNHYPDVNLIENKVNRGFAAANNQALQLSRGRYVFLLNPDGEFLPSTFGPMISFMDANPHIGLAGVKMINQDGSVQESFVNEYPGHKLALQETTGLKGSIAWVLGAGMIIRSDLMKQVGGFDESFFVYGEDQDLCFRIRKAGYEIGYNDTAIIVHLGAQSERQTESAGVWKKKILAEYIFYRKHYLPATVNKIMRGALMKARWRILTLSFLMPFYKEKSEAEEKLIKYSTALQTISDIRRKNSLRRI